MSVINRHRSVDVEPTLTCFGPSGTPEQDRHPALTPASDAATAPAFAECPPREKRGANGPASDVAARRRVAAAR
jgi:hypothetical protein